MRGYDVLFDQCSFGLTVPNTEGLVKKPTRVRSTKWRLVEALRPRLCTGRHPHVVLSGNVPGMGMAKTKFVENYPRSMARELARVLMIPDFEEDIFPTIDDVGQEGVGDPPPHVDGEDLPPPDPEAMDNDDAITEGLRLERQREEGYGRGCLVPDATVLARRLSEVATRGWSYKGVIQQ